jgi:hypothetical protein
MAPSTLRELKPGFPWRLDVAAKQAGEKVVYFVIPSEARNLSLLETQEKRYSSARSVPHNDKIVGFSAACKAATHKIHL